MTEQAKSGFNGDVQGLSLIDIVQLVCMEGDDRKITVQSQENNGVIYFHDNEIIHAECEGVTGKEAFYTIMSWPSGTFSMIFASTETRSIDASWNFLLIEAVRLIDEKENNGETDDTEDSLQQKVLVVDDSKLFTKAFVKLFEEEINAKVIGTATNGKEALKFLEVQVPDLVTLDINMPVMGGDSALKHIMIRSPSPVILVSNCSEQSCATLMDFMRLGAVDVVAKPINPQSWEIVSKRLHHIITHVKEFRVDNVSRAKKLIPMAKRITPEKPARELIVIIGGLGGMLELQKVVPSLEYNADTAIMILQDMYPSITPPLAAYLDLFTPFPTTTMVTNTAISGGRCQVGNCHTQWHITTTDGAPVVCGEENDTFEVSLDRSKLLTSASDAFGTALTIIILSGSDTNMKQEIEYASGNGATILLQEPDSCLLPAPIIELRDLAIKTHCLKPEEMGSFISNASMK